MSLNYPGGYVTKSPPTPTSTSAPGIWTMDQALQYIKAGTWPTPPIGDPYFQYTNLLLGTGSTNGAQNNTFLDSSSNNFTITRNGNTTQGSFTPFSQAAGYWSNYFDGTGDYLSTADSISLGSGDFTVGCWVYLNATGAEMPVVCSPNYYRSGYNGNFVMRVGTSNLYNSFDGQSSGTDISGTYSWEKGVWTYVAWVRSGSTITVYKNGTSLGTVSSSRDLSDSSNGLYIAVNRINNVIQSDNLNGYISNLRILVGTADTAVPTAPFTAITNTKLLTCQGNRFFDANTQVTAKTITVNGDTAVVPFQPFGAPTSPYNTPNVGGSGYFDGTGDYLTITSGVSNQFDPGSAFTFECWVYLLSGTNNQCFEVRGSSNSWNGSTGILFQIYTNYLGNSYWQWNGNGTALSISGTAPPNNSWAHLAVGYDGTTTRFWINGKSVGTSTNGYTKPTYSNVAIGSNVSNDVPMNGYMGGLRFVKGTDVYGVSNTNITVPTTPLTAISNTSLLTNFTNAGIFDNAAKNDMETVGNAQVSTSVTKFGNSVAFDGSGDRLTIPYTNTFLDLGVNSEQFTLEAWIYPTNTMSSTGQIFSKGGGTASWSTSSGAQYQLSVSSSVLSWTFNSSGSPVQLDSPTLTLNTWTHVAVSYQGGTTKLFINGNQVASSTSSYTAPTTRNLQYIGMTQSGGYTQEFYGNISNFRVTKGLGRYPYNFTPPTQAFGTIYKDFGTPAADPYFDYTTLLLPGSGTNGAQNNTFLDSSSNTFSITRNGNTTQGTFSPFSQTGWSNYFDGTANGSLRADSSTDTNLSGDFTVQAWVFPTANGQSSNSEIISRGAASTTNGWRLGLVASSTKPFFAINYAGLGNNASSTESGTNLPLNQWSYVAVTRSGNTCKIYINGQLDTTNTGFTGTPTVSGTEYVYVGRASYDTSNRQFTGYVSNASIIKGTALTTFNTTTPLATGTSGQSLLTCTANRFIDANTATTEKTLTVGTGASVQAFSPFAPTAAYSAATNGGSGYFDGTGDYLTVASNTAFNVGSGDFTEEFWIYPTTASLTGSIIDKRSDAGNYSECPQIQISSNQPILYVSYTGSSWAVTINGSSNVKPYSWNHIAATRSGSTWTLWLNGASVGTATSSGTVYSGSSSLVIGAASSAGEVPITGYLNGVRIVKGTAVYTGAFTPPTAPLTNITNTSLLCNFTNAGITDATAKNNLETVGNAQISNGAAKWGSTSMYFDGTGDYLLIPDGPNLDFGTGDWTIEAWVNFSSVSSTRCIASNYLNSSSGWSIELSAGVIKVALSGDSYDITGTTTISTGTWYHVAVTKYESSVKLFVNGNQEGSTYTGAVSLDTTSALNVGRLGTLGGDELNGYIQDLRVTKGIARYTQNFTPPTAAFQLL